MITEKIRITPNPISISVLLHIQKRYAYFHYDIIIFARKIMCPECFRLEKQTAVLVSPLTLQNT